MNFTTNFERISNDLMEVARQFKKYTENCEITHSFNENDEGFFVRVEIDGENFDYLERKEDVKFNGEIEKLRKIKRINMLAMYKAVTEKFNCQNKWGSLMGIRPVKLYRSLAEKEKIDAESYFRDYYLVSEEKTSLVKDIYNIQQEFYSKSSKDINLYIGIPFCLSRCYYCSFISQDITLLKDKSIMDDFVDSLVMDIENAKELIKKNGYSLRTVYMGGGTPTALSAKQLEKVLKVCDFKHLEFTVEGGRPDTLDEEKIALIAKYANRISVNPQTTKDETLKLIGRKHTSKEFFEAFELAKKHNLSINCDLIAGLVGETVEDFEKSILDVINLIPDNITVHTLALKAGSKLKEQTDKNENSLVDQMLNVAYRELANQGYNPYYLYRQKYMADNLENTGFFKKSPCVYNIDIMEENTSIIACGSNGVSKRFFKEENRIERFGYPKDTKTYIEKLEQNMIKREELFRWL